MKSISKKTTKKKVKASCPLCQFNADLAAGKYDKALASLKTNGNKTKVGK